jgi:hypothetical protein
MSTLQAALVYFHQDDAYVTPESETVDGLWIATSPCTVTSADQLESVAVNVLAALQVSKTQVPAPPADERRDAELLALARVGSFAVFANGTRVVRLTATDSEVTLTPLRRARRGGFFERMDSIAFTVEREVAAVTAGLERARDRAEGSSARPTS